MTTVKPLVTRSDDGAWGASVFAGTRVPVDTLLDYRGSDETLDEFLCQFPKVAREQPPGVLEQSRRLARELSVPA